LPYKTEVVALRFAPDEIARLDALRGEHSRQDYLRALVMASGTIGGKAYLPVAPVPPPLPVKMKKGKCDHPRTRPAQRGQPRVCTDCGAEIK